MDHIPESIASTPRDPRSQSGASTSHRSTRPLLETSVSSSSRSAALENQDVATKSTGTVFVDAKKSEGKFTPKAPDVQKRKIIDEAFDFESAINAAIIHFHEISEDRTYFYVRGEPTIPELVFAGTPASYMASKEREQPSSKPDLRWIHLPANNMSWVQGVVTRIYSEKDQQDRDVQVVPEKDDPAGKSAGKRPSKGGEPSAGPKRRRTVSFDVINTQGHLQTSAGDDSVKPFLLLRPDLWEGRQSRNDAAPRSVQGRFLRPVYSKVSTDVKRLDEKERLFLDEDASRNCVLFMPYIHWESVAMYTLRNKCLAWMAAGGCPDKEESSAISAAPKAPSEPRDVKWKNRRADTSAPWNRQQVEEMAKSPEFRTLPTHAKLLLAYVHEDLPLHVRRTLDQSYYHTLPDEDIQKRDLDQVLFRYTYKTLRNGVASRLLMVDQLWLWVIDEPGKTKTVLTAFPPRWEVDPDRARADPTDVHNRVIRALESGDANIFSVTDLVGLIIDKCCSLFHPGVCEADSAIDYLESFTVAIAALADAQTRQTTIIKTCSDRLEALKARKDELSVASFKERIFGVSKQKDVDEPRPVSSKHQAGAISTPEPKADGEHGPSIKAWFQEVTEQGISQCDPLADLAALLQSHSRPRLDLEIEKEMYKLIDGRAENESLMEIKDILDELNSIAHIFKQQIKLLEHIVVEQAPPTPTVGLGPRGRGRSENVSSDSNEDFIPISLALAMARTARITSTRVHHGEHALHKYIQLLATLQRRADDFENLTTEAMRVYNAICDILDLKQKQATVQEAVSSRQDSKESARQGQIILIFTVVTIIFLPLSFVAAVFSMNATEINNMSNHSLRQIWKIMWPTMVGVVALSLIVAFFPYIWWVVVGTLGIIGRFGKTLLSACSLRRSDGVAKEPHDRVRSSPMMSGARRTALERGTPSETAREKADQEKEDEDLYGTIPPKKPMQRVTGQSAPHEELEIERPSSLYRSGKGFFYDAPRAPLPFFTRRRQNRDSNV